MGIESTNLILQVLRIKRPEDSIAKFILEKFQTWGAVYGAVQDTDLFETALIDSDFYVYASTPAGLTVAYKLCPSAVVEQGTFVKVGVEELQERSGLRSSKTLTLDGGIDFNKTTGPNRQFELVGLAIKGYLAKIYSEANRDIEPDPSKWYPKLLVNLLGMNFASHTIKGYSIFEAKVIISREPPLYDYLLCLFHAGEVIRLYRRSGSENIINWGLVDVKKQENGDYVIAGICMLEDHDERYNIVIGDVGGRLGAKTGSLSAEA